MKDITGQKFGLLTATKVTKKKAGDGSLIWGCICDCGNPYEANGSYLRNGTKTHCGCLNKYGNQFTDLTGQKFEHLTVLKITGKAEDGSYDWLVYCECNPEILFPVNGCDLRRGRKTNCGCRHGNRVNLIGEMFGNLEVIDFEYDVEEQEFLWICLCNCGELTSTKTGELTSSSKRSCGCLKSQNLVRRRFGKLTVTKKLNKIQNGYHLWEVLCDCGNIDKATTGHLKSGNKKSCGCLIHVIENITGEKRNMLTAKKIADFRSPNDEVLWQFLCDCGNTTYATRDKFLNGHKRSCGCLKDLSFDKHPNWKGGVSEVSKFLRRNINEWKQTSFQATNYKCYITNEQGKLIVHHANEQHPFHVIVEETFEVTKLPKHLNIGEYTKEQINLLVETCLDLHFKYGLGMPLKPKLHREFHRTFGFTDWTSGDFKAFVEQKRQEY